MSIYLFMSQLPKNYINQKDYDHIISLMVRVCLDFLVVKNGKVLLTHRLIHPYKGFWHFPGGMVRKGETIDQAAERILIAELGLKPASKELLGYIEYLHLENPEKKIVGHDITLVFRTILEKGPLRGSFQAEEMEFFTYSQLPDKTIPEVKDFIGKHQDNV